ncbi:phosphoribosylformylglycinamidine cyclo-ligase [Haemophilus paracuniculus]|uniref:Phosphoribosylformylglycinamidine cyclo-ligase n=1 Tax=Haemophilus paracuniculus TaxID=734 RepID=A0A1T0AS82_9PAST|nr:phosphoribosylformylglycinamidine cyclo-ligase [Haemophilus paracuniculus]OOR99254.1 phosphoribosylformylglycinamidine cyclo-ligase [Haemophilus paracuniculus]
MSYAYKQAGVDVHAGYETVERIKKHVAKTHRFGVLGGLGGFGGLFDLGSLNYKHPILVSGTDGVGTKLLLAIQQQKFDTIGIDCVAMCVNDVVTVGADPLYFLDYVAVGKNKPEVVEQIVAGVAKGCELAGTALIGGETAEMPDMYAPEDFDLAGFTVGVVEKDEMLQPNQVQAGDVLIGLASSGIHSNGYSLVRKLFFKDNQFGYDHQFPELNGKTLGEELLTPTRIYVKEILALHKQKLVNGVAHITGGGFIENIPRMFSEDLTAKIQMGSWEVLPIFSLMQKLGNFSQAEMLGTFNLGVGMVVAVKPENVEQTLATLAQFGTTASVIGEVVKKSENLTALTGNEVVL